MFKHIQPFQIIIGYFISIVSFSQAYSSYAEGRTASLYLFLIGGVLIIILHTAAWISISSRKKANNAAE
jgi:predicted permease